MTQSEARMLLGVSDTATVDQIKSAYRKSANQWHPDKHGNSPIAKDTYQRINEAKDALLNPAPPTPQTSGGGLSGLLDALLTTAADSHNVKVVNAVVGERHGPGLQATLSTFLDYARGDKPK